MPDKLEFILSQRDPRPMYLQIMDQIKNQVTTGDWPQGFQLPSIRAMAVATKVSVITVKRAYQELENQQVIVTQPGKGSFIASDINLTIQIKDEELEKYLVKAITIAHSIGMDKEQLQKRLKKLQTSTNQNNINKSEKKGD